MNKLFNTSANKKRLYNPLWWVLFTLVIAYRFITKPFGSRCRFVPTCSTYALDALNEYGFVKSVILISKRISKCHPFHPGGFDYVNKKDALSSENTDKSE